MELLLVAGILTLTSPSHVSPCVTDYYLSPHSPLAPLVPHLRRAAILQRLVSAAMPRSNVEATRALLDQLMGKDRNLTASARAAQRASIHYTSDRICPHFLVAFCPHTLSSTPRATWVSACACTTSGRGTSSGARRTA